MSRVAKSPVTIPAGVTVTINGQDVQVKGAKGELSTLVHDLVAVAQEGAELKLSPREDSQAAWMQAGTARAVLNNLVIGVSAGFERRLQLIGVGYKAAAKGKVLNLALGFSHPVEIEIPEGLKVTAEKNLISVSGINKDDVGSFAAMLRALKKPEPYKGKGMRYENEIIKRKQGKKSV